MAGEAPTNVILGQLGQESRNVVLKGSAGPQPEISKKVQKRVDAYLKADKETNFREQLIETVEDLQDKSGDFLRAKDKYAYDSHHDTIQRLVDENVLEHADIADAEDRSTRIAEAEPIIDGLIKGFNGLEKTEQDTIVNVLTKRFKTTDLGSKYLQKDPNVNLEPVVREMLRAGLNPNEIHILHKDYEQWIDSANADLDPLHQEIKSIQTNHVKIQEQTAELGKKMKKTDATIAEKKAEQEDYTQAGGKKYKEIETLEKGGAGQESETDRKADIETLTDELDYIERQLEARRSALVQAIEKQTGAPATGLLLDALLTKYLGMNIPTAASGPDIKALDSEVKTLSSERSSKTRKLGALQEKQQKLEDLRNKRDEYPETLKQLEKEKVQHEEAQAELMEIYNISEQQMASTLKKFAVFEDRLTATMEREIIDKLLKRHNNILAEIAIQRLEKAMTAVNEDRMQELREFLNNRWLTMDPTGRQRVRRGIGKAAGYIIGVPLDVTFGLGGRNIQNWIENRFRGKEFEIRYKTTQIEQDYQNALLRPGDNYENIDGVIREAYKDPNNTKDPYAEWRLISKDEKQRQQLRASFAVELNVTRQQAFNGRIPTELEQRILATQPWTEELIKAGAIGNPEFMEQVNESVPDVTAEAIKNNDPQAITKVRNAAIRDRALFLLMFGLGATQALSQIQKEGTPQHA